MLLSAMPKWKFSRVVPAATASQETLWSALHALSQVMKKPTNSPRPKRELTTQRNAILHMRQPNKPLCEPDRRSIQQLPGRLAGPHGVPRRRLADLAVPVADDRLAVRVDPELGGARVENDRHGLRRRADTERDGVGCAVVEVEHLGARGLPAAQLPYPRSVCCRRVHGELDEATQDGRAGTEVDAGRQAGEQNHQGSGRRHGCVGMLSVCCELLGVDAAGRSREGVDGRKRVPA